LKGPVTFVGAGVIVRFEQGVLVGEGRFGGANAVRWPFSSGM
jgi:hypothetical protein